MNKQTKKVAIWLSSIAIIASGIYIGFRYFKKRKVIGADNKGATPDTPLPPSSSSGSQSGSSNPFSSKEQVKEFQQFVIDNMKDRSILGASGADGIWGPKTASAYSKYRSQWLDFKTPIKMPANSGVLSPAEQQRRQTTGIFRNWGFPNG